MTEIKIPKKWRPRLKEMFQIIRSHETAMTFHAKKKDDISIEFWDFINEICKVDSRTDRWRFDFETMSIYKREE